MQFAKYDTLTLDLARGRVSWPDDTIVAYLSLRQPDSADVVLGDAQPLSSNYYAPTPMDGKVIASTGSAATLRAAPVKIETYGGQVSFQFVVFADANNDNRLMFWAGFPTAPIFAPAILTIGQVESDGLFNVCQLQ